MFIQNMNLKRRLGMSRLMEAPTDGGSGSSTGGTETQPDGGNPDSTEPTEKTFTQKDVDKLIQDRIAREQSKWEKKVQEEKTEAEKLAKMKADEKAKYQEEKRLAELENREKAITTRELRATTLETLTEKKLPNELADIINYSSADSCKESIEAIENAWVKAQGSWQEAVEAEANKRLRGGNPPKGGQGDNNQSVFGFNFTGVRPKK